MVRLTINLNPYISIWEIYFRGYLSKKFIDGFAIISDRYRSVTIIKIFSPRSLITTLLPTPPNRTDEFLFERSGNSGGRGPCCLKFTLPNFRWLSDELSKFHTLDASP